MLVEIGEGVDVLLAAVSSLGGTRCCVMSACDGEAGNEYE
jgi:hypothetical protein